MTGLRAWFRERTPVLRRMYPLALPFIFVAIAVWTLMSPQAAMIVSIMALTVVGIIVWASWGRDDDETDGPDASPSAPDVPSVYRSAHRISVPRRMMPRRQRVLAVGVFALAIAAAVGWALSRLHEASQPRQLDRDVREAMARNPGLMQERDARSLYLAVPAGDYSVDDLRVTARDDGLVEIECLALTGIRGHAVTTRGYKYYRALVRDGRMAWETRQLNADGYGMAHETIKLDIDAAGKLTLAVQCPIPQ